MTRPILRIAFILVLVCVACRKSDEPDAYGNVEAIDVVVGAEASGQIDSFSVAEGAELAAGAIVGSIDIASLRDQVQEVESQRSATASKIEEIAQQIDALQIQREIAKRAYDRTRRLYDQKAATAQQLDQAERDYRVLGEEIEGARARQQSVAGEVRSSEARLAQLNRRIGEGTIINPVAGTVLATYAEPGEMIQAGQPLYRIADLGRIEVRAYVTEPQLASLRIGQNARISVDSGDGQETVMSGSIIWISSDAEFTPTPIQTREERADLVYAVKIEVSNPDGVLKIGMPVDVEFTTGTTAS